MMGGSYRAPHTSIHKYVHTYGMLCVSEACTLVEGAELVNVLVSWWWWRAHTWSTSNSRFPSSILLVPPLRHPIPYKNTSLALSLPCNYPKQPVGSDQACQITPRVSWGITQFKHLHVSCILHKQVRFACLPNPQGKTTFVRSSRNPSTITDPVSCIIQWDLHTICMFVTTSSFKESRYLWIVRRIVPRLRRYGRCWRGCQAGPIYSSWE